VDYQIRDQPDEFTIVDISGAARNLHVFGELEPFLQDHGVLRKGLIRGHVRCLLLRGRAFLEMMLPILRRDPNFMLARPAFESTASLGPASGTDLATI
jgi:hypothetical protein